MFTSSGDVLHLRQDVLHLRKMFYIFGALLPEFAVSARPPLFSCRKKASPHPLLLTLNQSVRAQRGGESGVRAQQCSEGPRG